MLLSRLAKYSARAIERLSKELEQPVSNVLSAEVRTEMGHRRANAAVALLELGEGRRVWPLLAHTPDPTMRVFLIHRFAMLGANPRPLYERLKEEMDPAIRRALLLSLGEYDPYKFAAMDHQNVLSLVHDLYTSDPQPAVHSAAEWVERQWKMMDVDNQPREPLESPSNKGWYTTAYGQTMLFVAPGQHWHGHGPTRRQPHVPGFFISSTEVTNGQYLSAGFPEERWQVDQRRADADFPATSVSLYEAAAYCNHLSEQEGLPRGQWCYEPNAAGDYAEGMRQADDFPIKSGYRLPTPVEWESACRAGTITQWNFGEALELFDHYSWNVANSRAMPRPVALLKPNDFGLFDTHGNVAEWCTNTDVAGQVAFRDDQRHQLRGGTFNHAHGNCRSMMYDLASPARKNIDAGFRVVRSVPISATK